MHPLDSSHSSHSHSKVQFGAEEEKKCHELSFLFEEGYDSEDAAAAGQSSSYEESPQDKNVSQPMRESLQNEPPTTNIGSSQNT